MKNLRNKIGRSELGQNFASVLCCNLSKNFHTSSTFNPKQKSYDCTLIFFDAAVMLKPLVVKGN
jgi:hypothetical protein